MRRGGGGAWTHQDSLFYLQSPLLAWTQQGPCLTFRLLLLVCKEEQQGASGWTRVHVEAVTPPPENNSKHSSSLEMTEVKKKKKKQRNAPLCRAWTRLNV